MQSAYEERFEREMACTPQEWLRALPQAIGGHEWRRDGDCVYATIGAGNLRIAWREGEPKQIALVRLPVLHVRFEFDGADPEARHAFMKRFDLYMQRGGG